MASTLLNEQGVHPDLIELQLAHAERKSSKAVKPDRGGLPSVFTYSGARAAGVSAERLYAKESEHAATEDESRCGTALARRLRFAYSPCA
jgi:hypothetical protein